MNAERLRELSEFLERENTRLEIQRRLEALRNALQQLGSSPGDSDSQNAVVQSRNQFEDSIVNFVVSLTPALRASIGEIKGTPYFTEALASNVREAIDSNAMTPAVAHQRVGAIFDGRREYLDNLERANASLAALGIRTPETYDGEAEVGFLLPRGLFDNQLDNFSKELSQIDRIARTYSELVTGSVTPPTLRQISSTDPLIFVGVQIGVVIAIARSITWMLETWKKALEIKSLYGDAKALNLPEQLLKGFEDSIKKHVDESIEHHTNQLMAQYTVAEDRQNEMRTALRFGMRYLIERIERGMQVEVRYLRDGKQEGAKDGPPGGPTEEQLVQLREIAKDLSFPAVTGEPLLKLAATIADEAENNEVRPEEPIRPGDDAGPDKPQPS